MASQYSRTVRVSGSSDPFFKAQTIMTRSYLPITGARSAQEKLPSACTVGPNLQSHAKTPLDNVGGPCDVFTWAFRSLFKLRGYRFVPVP